MMTVTQTTTLHSHHNATLNSLFIALEYDNQNSNELILSKLGKNNYYRFETQTSIVITCKTNSLGLILHSVRCKGMLVSVWVNNYTNWRQVGNNVIIKGAALQGFS